VVKNLSLSLSLSLTHTHTDTHNINIKQLTEAWPVDKPHLGGHLRVI
jgi:hypothetical protein